MLRKLAIVTALVLVVNAGLESVAEAQQPVRRPRRGSIRNTPPVSPYLNLFRRDSGLANNYYNLVRPEQEFRQGIQNNQYGIQNLQRETNTLRAEQRDVQQYLQRQAAGSTLGITGHGTTFMNTGNYYGGRR